MATIEQSESESADKALVILQSLVCLLREKNILSRGDIEDLRDKIESRAANHGADPLPCCAEGVDAAAIEMAKLGTYIERRYGGKHRRTQ
ncbi:hypothetical protein EAH79_14095 [Sphingomonas koreensis]|nr:hypothetical protein EAH87_09550 [Sphingomonas koreensis]TPG39818.1 hypothetical protein EAH79_14095 [Sphingomonas koreensis]